MNSYNILTLYTTAKSSIEFKPKTVFRVSNCLPNYFRSCRVVRKCTSRYHRLSRRVGRVQASGYAARASTGKRKAIRAVERVMSDASDADGHRGKLHFQIRRLCPPLSPRSKVQNVSWCHTTVELPRSKALVCAVSG